MNTNTNNLTFFTHLKSKFHQKFRLSGDTKDIYFTNKSFAGPLGIIDNVRFVVSLPMNGKVVKWECSYKNEPMKNGVFNVTIEAPNEYCWLDNLNHKFVLSMTTSLNNLSIDTLLEGFSVAYDYYKSVRAESEKFVSEHYNDNAALHNFVEDHVSMTKDAIHRNEICLGDINVLADKLCCDHEYDRAKCHELAFIDDYGEMIYDAVMAMRSQHCIAKEKIPAPSSEAEVNAFFNELTK